MTASSVFFASLLTFNIASAEPIPPDLQAKVERYKQKLLVWAADQDIIDAAIESNTKGRIEHLSNAEWAKLSIDDPIVTKLNHNAAAKKLTKWEEDRLLEKLNLRDQKGYLAAFASHTIKPIIYNAAARPPIVNGLKGIWSANEVKPDPATKAMSVQISAPILFKGEVVGVLHSSVLAK
jgi:hypothetical protein